MRAIGARIIMSDLRKEKRDAAQERGVPLGDIVLAGQSVQEFANEKRLGKKIDTVLELVGTVVFEK